jgi:hypothetical protein
VSQVAIVTWSLAGASTRAGDVVIIEEDEGKRVRVRHAQTGHVSRLLAGNLVRLPDGIGPQDARVVELAPQMRGLLSDCSYETEANELGVALVAEVFGLA